MRYLRVKDWKDYQHYNDRRPPWIKLYTALLDATEEPNYASLPDNAKLLLHHIWLLAALTDDKIPDKWLNADRLNLHSFSRQALSALLASGFVKWDEDASKVDSKNPLSVSLSSVPLSSAEGEREGEFSALWAKYPRRIGRRAALKAYCASVQTPDDARDIAIALDNYNAEIARLGTDERYVKHGSTWFNNWRDYVNLRPALRAVPSPEDQHVDEVRECAGALKTAVRTTEPGPLTTTYVVGNRIVAVETTTDEARAYVAYAQEHQGDFAGALTFEEWRGSKQEAK